MLQRLLILERGEAAKKLHFDPIPDSGIYFRHIQLCYGVIMTAGHRVIPAVRLDVVVITICRGIRICLPAVCAGRVALTLGFMTKVRFLWEP
jgi:hypothetical protein